MKNKLIIRILGALASALVIVSVFVPFVRVTGYSQSLWQANSFVGALYLPIMIIVFGAIGVLVFSLNIKTELAYASTGALLFYLIMQTIPIVEQGTFNTLSVGYYFLVVGTILMGVIAFLNGIKRKQKVVEKKDAVDEIKKEDSMLNQIDRLYNNESSQTNDMVINQLDAIQPLQTTSDIPIAPLQTPTQANPITPVVSNVAPELTVQEQPVVQPMVQEQPVVQPMVQEQPIIQPMVQEQPVVQPTMIVQPKKEENISLQDLSNQGSMPANVATSEFNVTNVQESPSGVNPVVAEFGAPQPSEPANTNPVVAEFGGAGEQTNSSGVNPVVAEFSSSVEQKSSILSKPVVEEVKEEIKEPSMEVETIQPLASTTSPVDLMAENSASNNAGKSNLDIFG